MLRVLVIRSGMPHFLRNPGFALGILIAGIGRISGDTLEEALERNDFAAAEVHLEALAAEWAEATKAGDRPDAKIQYGLTLQALGVIERQSAKPQEALDHLENAVKLLAGASPSARADAAEALALTHQDLGRLEEAEQGLREVVKLRVAENPPDPALGQSRDHLALALLARGKYPEAGAMLQQNLDATPDTDPLARARRLAHFGRYQHTLGSYSRAAGIFREALALEFTDAELRLSLRSQLALAELRLGKIEAARQGMEDSANQASALFQNSGRSFLAAPFLINLGALDLSLGDALIAKESFAKALELLGKSLPPDHPSMIVPLNNLGCAEQAAGNFTAAAVHLKRAAELQQQHLPRVHLRVAETARNLARNALLSQSPDSHAEIDRATGLGIELLEELIRHGSEQERLNFLQRLDLVSLPCATGDAERIAAALIASKARVLDSMLANDAPRTGPAPTWQDIQQTLPQGSALIDACRYTTEGPDSMARYGAIVLLPVGPPKWVPLGSDEDLQRWLAAFRKRLTWRAGQLSGQDTPPPALKLRAILRSLHREFWEPLARELPAGTEDIAFSPDGGLHFLPLPALLDPELRPLCTLHRQVASIASARDLLGSAASPRLSEKPWTVLGVSDFPKSATPPGDDRLLNLLAALDPMPGTTEESRRIRALAPRGSTFLRDDRATESALSNLGTAPGVLHLGCHAFFLAGEIAAGGVVDFDENADVLFSGGLLLHGAALRGPDSPLQSPGDDLLFPSEVAALPLKGTRLVTLSSCESGAGTAVSGEGLLGLRRGFALAGAREVVVALWPVSDQSTPTFMERFYQLALESDRPAQSLWQCQREFLTADASEDGFEAAVLRYGPFVIGQNTPLMPSEGPITTKPSSKLPWRFILLGLPLLAFAVARFLKKRA
jgi:CHAT domain-containing protein/tetratricopeptide (TPR) repeat protein